MSRAGCTPWGEPRGRRRTLPAVACLTVLSLAALPARAAIRHVPLDYATIAAALAAASTLDTVLVEPGVYAEDLDLPSGVHLLGNGPPESVILQGSGATSVVSCQGTAPGTRLESLTVRGGAGTLDSGARLGGGIYLQAAHLTLQDVRLVENQADLGGGLCADNSTVQWSGGLVADNQATLGGGLFLFQGSHVVSGLSAERNQATDGGALYLSEVTLLSMDGSAFRDNGAGGDGGAGAGTASAMTAAYCRFEGNVAGGAGGGFALGEGCAMEFSFCVFFDNQATGAGGGLSAQCDGLPGSGCSEALLAHCDIFRNRAPLAAAVAVDGAARVRIEGSAVAGNDSPPACLDPRGELEIHCSATAANGSGGASACSIAESEVVVADPHLCDLDAGQLERCANSPLLVPPPCDTETYGALGAGCGPCGPTQAVAQTWGRLKVRYR